MAYTTLPPRNRNRVAVMDVLLVIGTALVAAFVLSHMRLGPPTITTSWMW
jgi:hypothetical protein